MSAVTSGKSTSVEALTQEVFRSVKEFTEGEAISDDITLLALQYNG
jgi:serine phosphatase RsbU (regulator of sigma subunit)